MLFHESVEWLIVEKSKLQKLEQRIIDCTKCSRLRAITVYPMPHAIYSTKDIDILIVGRNPGLEHDYSDVKFEDFLSTYKTRYTISRVGKYLETGLGASIWTRCAITNLCKCSSPKNSQLLKTEIQNCRSYLIEQIKIFKPKIILTLGKDALIYLFGETFSSLLWNTTILDTKTTTLVSIFHPSYLMYSNNSTAKQLNTFKLNKIKDLLK